MAKLSIINATISEQPVLKRVGKNNTPLCTLNILEKIFKKGNDGKWELVKTNTFPAKVWGDKANEMALLPAGQQIDLSAEIVQGDNLPWVKYRVELQDEENEYKGKVYHNPVMTIFDWDVVTKGNNEHS
jgi:hypothetical protein